MSRSAFVINTQQFRDSKKISERQLYVYLETKYDIDMTEVTSLKYYTDSQ